MKNKVIILVGWLILLGTVYLLFGQEPPEPPMPPNPRLSALDTFSTKGAELLRTVVPPPPPSSWYLPPFRYPPDASNFWWRIVRTPTLDPPAWEECPYVMSNTTAIVTQKWKTEYYMVEGMTWDMAFKTDPSYPVTP